MFIIRFENLEPDDGFLTTIAYNDGTYNMSITIDGSQIVNNREWSNLNFYSNNGYIQIKVVNDNFLRIISHGDFGTFKIVMPLTRSIISSLMKCIDTWRKY